MGDEGYTESLLARELLRGNVSPEIFGSTTINGGIHESAPVDSTGPATAPTTTAPAATQASLDMVSLFGMPEAALNQTEPHVKLSLQDAIYRAAKHSLAIKVDSYTPGISEAALIQAESVFDPVIFGHSNWSNTDTPASPVQLVTNGQSWDNEIGVKELLPSGATVSAFAQTIYYDLPSASTSFNRINYTSALNLTITQPLLKGFGSDYSEEQIYLAQRDLRISAVDFKKTALTSIGQVEEAYYDVVSTKTIVEIDERLAIAGQQTYNLMWDRRNLDVTKESLELALTALYQRQEQLIRDQENYRLASDNLKSLINDPEMPTASNILIDPTDLPTVEPFSYSAQDCIMRALQQRPEMVEQRLKIEKADITVRFDKNGLLPQLDLTAGMQTNAINNSLENSFAQTISPANFISWNAGVTMQFPLGNRAAEAQLVGDELSRRQAVENLMNVAEQVVEDVKTQLHGVLSGYIDIQALDKVRLAAAATIEGNLDLEPIRPKTPEALQTKLQEQQALAAAETQLVQAIVNYNKSIERVERSQGTLLEFDHISLDHPPLPHIKNSFGNWFFNGHTLLPFGK